MTSVHKKYSNDFIIDWYIYIKIYGLWDIERIKIKIRKLRKFKNYSNLDLKDWGIKWG